MDPLQSVSSTSLAPPYEAYPESRSVELRTRAIETRTLVPRLPPELIDRIIDFVGSAYYFDDERRRSQTLLNCALTCRACVAASVYHLYTDSLLCFRSEAHFRAFMRRVAEDDIVAAATKRAGNRYVNNGSNKGHRAEPLVLAAARLPAICPNLKRIVLQGLMIPKSSLEADLLFRGLGRWKQVTSLSLHRIVFRSSRQFQRLVCAITALKELTIWDVQFPMPSTAVPGNALILSPSPELQSLHMSSVPGESCEVNNFISAWLLHGKSRESIRTLIVRKEDHLKEWLPAAANHLESLDCRLQGKWTQADLIALNLSQCKVLKVFVVVATSGPSWSEVVSMLHLLGSSECRMQRLNLDFWTGSDSSLPAWEDFHNVLAMSPFSKLKHIMLYIKRSWATTANREEIVRKGSGTMTFETLMSKLDARCIEVDYSFYSFGTNRIRYRYRHGGH